MLGLIDTARFRPEALFHPRSVVLVRDGSEHAARVAANLAAFPGPLHVAGQADAGTALPYADLAVLACADPALLRAVAAAGIAAAICTTPMPGLAQAASDAGVTVLGPASFGLVVPAIGLNASTAHIPVRGGKVALVSQSASLCRAVLDWAGPNGVGFSHVVGVGGNAQCGFSLALDWLSRDATTGAILLDIRTVRDRRGFLAAARAAARLRPVVALRAGGRLQDPSGRTDLVFAAALQRAGVLRVGTLSELLGAAETLTRTRPPRADALVIATNAVGPAHLAADAAVGLGIPLLPLDEAARAGLALPAGPTDPGIVWAGAEEPARVAAIAAALAGLPATGGVLAILAPTGPADAAAVAALLAQREGMGAPLLACVLGETTAAPHRATLAAAGIPVFATPESAVRAFAQLVQQRRARLAAAELPPSRVLDVEPDHAAVRRIIAAARAEGRAALAQDESLAVFAAYGIPAIASASAATPLAARLAAGRLGLPAVVKRRRTARPGEGAAGSVALDLPDAAAVERAAERLLPGPFVIQRQAGRGRELRVGVADDPLFGPAIGFGPGGAPAHIGSAAAFELPPLNLPLARALIARAPAPAPARALLAAWSDQAAPDAEAVADALVRVSQLVLDHPEIGEIEINPLLATPSGVCAIDAWIAFRPAGAAASFAIAPYPAELEERFEAGGDTLLLRPIRPEDAEAHLSLFRRLTPEDVRYRFFNLLRDLPPLQVRRMTEVDYINEMALIAVRPAAAEGAQETVGVARLVIGGAGEAEFAVLVEAAMKGRGVARRLMTKLLEWARTRGLASITGQVLTENAPMLAFMRRLGADIRRVPGDGGVVEAVLPT